MKTALDQIVNAVLYQGYILYPYRASSGKNQRERFTFGRVYPRVYSESQSGLEPCAMQTECLLHTHCQSPKLTVTLGFLQPMKREVAALEKIQWRLTQNGEAKFQSVPQLEVNGKIFQTWTEAVERKVAVTLDDFSPLEIPFVFPASREREPIYGERGAVAGMISRDQGRLEGRMEIKATQLKEDLIQISVRVLNLSPMEPTDPGIPEDVMPSTFASTHFTLETETGEFVSLLETPPEFMPFAKDCKNIGCWPVLVGNERAGERRAVLASPIILYDYPKIAPASTANYFDGTEIDEMLALRVVTMSDEEKRETQANEFTRRILERTTAMDGEDLMKLHGSMHEMPASIQPPISNKSDPTEISSGGRHGSWEDFFNPMHPAKSVIVEGVELRVGDRVTICPKRRADAIDLMLAGKTATIEALEQDAKEQMFLALVLQDDSGADVGFERQSGRRFFYGADEVKPLKTEVRA